MLRRYLPPTIKNNSSSKISSSNDRPEMNSSYMLKNCKYCLLLSLSEFVTLNSRQFGVRRSTGCQSTILILMETTMNHALQNSDVHCAMVDLTKAFDKINKKILTAKIEKNYIIMYTLLMLVLLNLLLCNVYE